MSIKQILPVKICAECGRPFRWRKSLAAKWKNIKYCSAACRKRHKRKATV
jgi:hypothetical protein